MIYFDNAATTFLDDEVRSVISHIYDEYCGNAASSHALGEKSKALLENARQQIACCLNAARENIYFTSGATEAANIILQGRARFLKSSSAKRNKIIISLIEHHAVLEPANYLKQEGFEISYIKPDENGVITKDQLSQLIDDRTALVAIMAVNNEIGSISNISELVDCVKQVDKNIMFVTDAVQAVGKIQVPLNKVDAWFCSGHKVGAPIGIGCFYLNPQFRIYPLIMGGSQEKRLRSGTNNHIAAHLLSLAIKNKIKNLDENYEHVLQLKNHFLKQLISNNIEYECVVNEQFSTPYILSIVIPNVWNEKTINLLSDKGIYVSSKSACTHLCGQESHVISAISKAKNKAISPVRFSFYHKNSFDEINMTVQAIREIVRSSPV